MHKRRGAAAVVPIDSIDLPTASPSVRSSLARRCGVTGCRGLWLADKNDVALDQILNLRRSRLLGVEIGDVKPRNQLQSLARRRDQERSGVNLDVCGLRPRPGNGACGQEALDDRGGDDLDEAGEFAFAHREL